MKHVIVIIFFCVTVAHAQKTTRETISETRGMIITKTITGADTLFLFMGQNGKYTHITDIVMVKSGTPKEINDLLTECMKFIPEKSGSSLKFQGNTIMAMGGKQVMLFGTGRDQGDYVLLNQGVITRMQTDLRGHLK